MNKKKLWFFKKLHSLLCAGLNIRSILAGIGASDPALAPRIEVMLDALDRGANFADAIQIVFTLTGTEENLLRAAQATGNIEEALLQLVDYTEKNSRFKKEINKALLKPAMTFSIAFVIFVGVVTIIVPKVTSNLPTKKTPAVLEALISIGHIMPYVAALIVAAISALVVLYSINRLAFWRLILATPIIGPIKKHDAVYSMFMTTSLLWSGGVRLNDALELASANLNSVFVEAINYANMNLERGIKLKTSLDQAGFFPFYIMEIVDTAEQTGEYGKYFMEASRLAESDFEDAKSKLLPIVEMAVLMVIAAVIITTLLAVLIPIQEMAGSAFGQ